MAESRSKCEQVLKSPPNCADFRSNRSYAMCRARQLKQEKSLGLSPALKQAWKELRNTCKR